MVRLDFPYCISQKGKFIEFSYIRLRTVNDFWGLKPRFIKNHEAENYYKDSYKKESVYEL